MGGSHYQGLPGEEDQTRTGFTGEIRWLNKAFENNFKKKPLIFYIDGSGDIWLSFISICEMLDCSENRLNVILEVNKDRIETYTGTVDGADNCYFSEIGVLLIAMIINNLNSNTFLLRFVYLVNLFRKDEIQSLLGATGIKHPSLPLQGSAITVSALIESKKRAAVDYASGKGYLSRKQFAQIMGMSPSRVAGIINGEGFGEYIKLGNKRANQVRLPLESVLNYIDNKFQIRNSG